jgi:hypothetical protein
VRLKIRSSLDHVGDLDNRWCAKLPVGQNKVGELARLLHQCGAPDSCYVLSSNEEIDGREFRLEDALERVVGRGCGTFICCIPGQLTYFEGEKPDTHVLQA